jgi:hypothetical protein
MEDNLNFKKIQKTEDNLIQKYEKQPKKMEDDLKKINGRRPQK